jgi:tetratricopeptide (TPR) repeat protein
MAKLPTKEQWSTKKTTAGTDDLVRDKWHIGKHLEEYHKLKFENFDARIESLTELKRKFGEYKKAIIKEDKAKKFTEFTTDIDSIVKRIGKDVDEAETKKGIAAGDTKAMIKLCDEHLELRKNVVSIVGEVAKEVNGYLEDVKRYEQIAQKGCAQAKKAKQEKDQTTNMQGISLANNGYDEAQKIYEKAVALQKDKITKEGGKVMRSRLDGPIGQNEKNLDPEYVKTYKLQSGKYFADATKLTNHVNSAVGEMKRAVSEAQLAVEEAEINTMHALDTKKIETILKQVQESCTKATQILQLATTKLDGDMNQINVTLTKTGMSSQDKLKDLQLKYEKQFQPRWEIIKARREDVVTALKRIKSVPESTEDKNVDIQRQQVAKETAGLAQTYKSTSEKATKVDILYKDAIQQVSV